MCTAECKRAYANFNLPIQAYRAVYNLFTSLFMILLVEQWRSCQTQALWDFSNSIVSMLTFRVVFGALCALCLLQLVSFNVMDLLGLEDVNEADFVAKEGAVMKVSRRTMRHPIFWLTVLLFWTTPVMTVTRAMLAVSLTIYLLFGNSVSSSEDVTVEEIELAKSKRRLSLLRPQPFQK